jgi:cytochrome oxidase assembly protein ShyY1
MELVVFSRLGVWQTSRLVGAMKVLSTNNIQGTHSDIPQPLTFEKAAILCPSSLSRDMVPCTG